MQTVLLAFSSNRKQQVSIGWIETEDDEDPAYYCPERSEIVDPTHWMQLPPHPLKKPYI